MQRHLVFQFIACAGLLLAGCTRNEPRADLVIVNGPEPETLDPALMTGQADGRIGLAIFEGLTRYDPVTAAPTPAIAERWETSADGLHYRFFLRTNAAWSTGEPITAEDFVYSWLRVLDPGTASEYAGQLFYLRNAEEYNTGKLKDRDQVGVHAAGRHELRVDLHSPTAFFLDLCSFQTLAVVHRGAIEKFGDRWLMTAPVPASGAYELVSWRINDKIRLRKNRHYWDVANTLTDVIDLLPCTLATTALNLYETGAADVVWDKNLVPIDLLDLLSHRPDFHSFDYLGTYFFRCNVTRKPLSDPRVRQALALALDKRRIVTRITRGGEKVAGSFTPPGIANYTNPEGLGFDPERARRLLAEAGYPGGRGFPRIHYLLDSKYHEQIAVELQAMWKENLQIDVDLRQMEWKTYLRAQYMLEYDLSRSSWIGDYNDPNTFLDLFMANNGNNRTGWNNPQYDELIRSANRLTDLEKRAQLLQQAEKLLIEDELPIVPLFIYVGLEYYDDRKIKGIHSNIRGEHPLRAISNVSRRPPAAALPPQAPGRRAVAAAAPR